MAAGATRPGRSRRGGACAVPGRRRGRRTPSAPGFARRGRCAVSRQARRESTLAFVAATAAASCGRASSGQPAASEPGAVRVTVATAQEQPVDRMLRVTGTLLADEEAEVAAEVAGRVTGTPVERGSRVAEGAPLISLAPLEAQASATDAEANVAQLEARLALQPGQPFDVEQVPEVRDGEGGARPGRGRLQPHQEPARSEGRVAGRVRSAAQPGGDGAQPVPGPPATRRSSSTACSKGRGRAPRWRTRRWRTPWCGRRLPGSWSSAR